MANLTYFKKFETKNDYDDYINSGSPVLPNVSIVANEDVYFKDGETPEPPHDYFTIVSLGDGAVSMENWDNGEVEIEYRINDGEWLAVTVGGSSPNERLIDVSNGDEVQFRGENRNYGGWGQGSGFYFANTGRTTVPVNLKGNIMSLIYGDDFAGEVEFDEGDDMILAHLFQNSTVVNASGLILPATTLCDRCYLSMFYDCTSLTTAPALPATTLAYSCYGGMFGNCTSLTTAPSLPATTLASNCYESMFDGCTSLTTAPELPATTLVDSCYSSMFYGCTSLNRIKCLATDISANDCTYGWVDGVAETGIFDKSPDMNDWQTGTSGIPDGWDVQDA